MISAVGLLAGRLAVPDRDETRANRDFKGSRFIANPAPPPLRGAAETDARSFLAHFAAFAFLISVTL